MKYGKLVNILKNSYGSSKRLICRLYPLLPVLNPILCLNPKTSLGISANMERDTPASRESQTHPSGVLSEQEYPYIYKLGE